MDVVPESVGRVARVWDEQNLDLISAAGQIAGAGSACFSEGVRSSASRFLSAWERHTHAAATQCESQADGLRSTIQDYLDTDVAISGEYFRLAVYLTEYR